MLLTSHERLKDEIAELAERLGRGRSALIPILQEVQRKERYISDLAMQLIADQLDIHPVEVFSVVSFYSFLNNNPRGKFIIRLCQTISCELQGKEKVARQLENDLGIAFGETTKDGMFTLEWANCIGMCDQGPAMLVNEQVYTHVTPERVHEILEECRRAFGVHAMATSGERLL